MRVLCFVYALPPIAGAGRDVVTVSRPRRKLQCAYTYVVAAAH